MTTIFRIKRHRCEDPIEALILSCKRKRTENINEDNDLVEKVLNFSGTVEAKDNIIARKTVHSFKKGSKYSNCIKTHTPDIKLKQRKEQKERREDNVTALLNGLRSNNGVQKTEKDELDDLPKNYTIVDFYIDSSNKNFKRSTPDRCYVYDLYSFEDDVDFKDLFLENVLSIKPVENESKYRNGEDSYDEVNPDEDDSNDENNWRNDYPDTESSLEDEEDDEDDNLLVRKLRRCNLGSDGCELSDDSGEEEYLNYDDEEYYHYLEAKDLAGKRYAKYKANAMKQIIDDDDEIDTDASEDEEDFCDSEDLSNHGDSD